MRTRLNWFQEFYPTQSGKKQIEMRSIFSTRSIPAALRKSLAGTELLLQPAHVVAWEIPGVQFVQLPGASAREKGLLHRLWSVQPVRSPVLPRSCDRGNSDKSMHTAVTTAIHTQTGSFRSQVPTNALNQELFNCSEVSLG